MPAFTLTTEILRFSVADDWDQARQEWSLDHVYEVERSEPETCLCGHFPILEVCVIQNDLNGASATVGNCCVKKFMGLPSDKIFSAVKRVRKDHQKALNSEAIQHAYNKNWINEWERDFYLNTMRKRITSLTRKQREKRIQVNEKMLTNMKRFPEP